jgi:hypothetical protein
MQRASLMLPLHGQSMIIYTNKMIETISRKNVSLTQIKFLNDKNVKKMFTIFEFRHFKLQFLLSSRCK